MLYSRKLLSFGIYISFPSASNLFLLFIWWKQMSLFLLDSFSLELKILRYLITAQKGNFIHICSLKIIYPEKNTVFIVLCSCLKSVSAVWGCEGNILGKRRHIEAATGKANSRVSKLQTRRGLGRTRRSLCFAKGKATCTTCFHGSHVSGLWASVHLHVTCALS